MLKPRGTNAVSARGTVGQGRSRKTKAHLLPVRKSDVGGTWLVGDTGLGFLLDVREGAGRGVPLGGFSLGGPPVGATKVPPSRPPVPCARAALALPANSTAAKSTAQDRRQFHDCARLYYSLVPLIGRTANDKACRDRMKRQK